MPALSSTEKVSQRRTSEKKPPASKAGKKKAAFRKRRSNPSRPSKVRFPIVGVGASAGGLEAFMQLLQNLPADTGMAFVLIQHLDPDHESALTQLLAKATSMPVSEVTHGMPVAPDHICVIPPNANMAIVGGVLKL